MVSNSSVSTRGSFPPHSVTTAENTFFQQVATGDVAGTPAFEGSALALVDLGLVFDGVWDIWQIEGPSMVWYFRGAPHVHTWVHVRDPKAT